MKRGFEELGPKKGLGAGFSQAAEHEARILTKHQAAGARMHWWDARCKERLSGKKPRWNG